ncbi:ABC transporter permease [Heyndrickxia sporothermodurans]|uniref:ABC transporter permease n=1 Tax=Heyndrickxia sporothermodurans TaxID=46224 RepID=A0AB37HGN4_9BACI|nr:ABC transporter permease [Heyndrickxia sporothermodurans]MBL5767498.1 ABC transporter permease [Heyndrickxia sporothermodurans]MBL5770963.1 ABC transporter permease [Heyndrickxia sporothermodurans]MBL5774634.1 ABC transporter permease [Heyndrickxia sporothermodurans]MBL5778260.1 ABC transporter permease [Heyndrickxia sporothermodurans]MBL5781760.1 ABC transporter permease [Heyndrickxia sporothermodurans]
MSINHLILRNLKKNIKNYYLYVFALIFSVALYFAFVTLQYDPTMNEAKGSIKGAAALKAASILLIAIVAVFLLYANKLFMKRRSKEIGLFQLIGMTKNGIFRLMSVENLILYYGSLLIGIFIGFSCSKLIMMLLFKITDVETNATLQFSVEALIQTFIVFTLIYLVIMLMNYVFIKRQTILSLFRVISSAEGKVKKISVFEVLIGVIGIVLIISGYYVSSKLFDGDFSTTNELFMAMIFILGSVIIGTYLFYKGSVTFITNVIRKKKGGYLNINEVLSLSSIMFRMKSNALLLTIITTVSALAIGLLSLSYISYYSAEKTAEQNVPTHFSLINDKDTNEFEKALDAKKIAYNEKRMEVIQVDIDISKIMVSNFKELKSDPSAMTFPVISDKSLSDVDLSKDETLFSGLDGMLSKVMSLKDSGTIVLKGKKERIPQKYIGLKDKFILPYTFTYGGLPVAVVDDTVFQQLKSDLDPEIQFDQSYYVGIDIKDDANLKKANNTFKGLHLDDHPGNLSRLLMSSSQKQSMGLIMFIVGFLGLTFLITSGCILYFKQMDESEDEKPNYTILRKLGFTQMDLLKGIQAKQLFNFGIPLAVGLLHSYFAVKSGWFMFGTELWTPMIAVMVLYTVLYSIFGILSVLYYKKVIKDAL